MGFAMQYLLTELNFVHWEVGPASDTSGSGSCVAAALWGSLGWRKTNPSSEVHTAVKIHLAPPAGHQDLTKHFKHKQWSSIIINVHNYIYNIKY